MALGYPHPRYLLRDLTSRDIAEWVAYYSLEPWGQRHRDEQLSYIAARILNMFSRKGSKPLQIKDFIIQPRLDEAPERPQQADDQKAIGIFRALRDNLRQKRNG